MRLATSFYRTHKIHTHTWQTILPNIFSTHAGSKGGFVIFLDFRTTDAFCSYFVNSESSNAWLYALVSFAGTLRRLRPLTYEYNMEYSSSNTTGQLQFCKRDNFSNNSSMLTTNSFSFWSLTGTFPTSPSNSNILSIFPSIWIMESNVRFNAT